MRIFSHRVKKNVGCFQISKPLSQRAPINEDGRGGKAQIEREEPGKSKKKFCYKFAARKLGQRERHQTTVLMSRTLPMHMNIR